jgi:hypothetical protein
MTRLGVPINHNGKELLATEPVSGFTARIHVAPRIAQDPTPATPYNGPGRTDRWGRAPGVVRDYAIKPRKLGHTVIGTVNLEATMRFFTEGIGFKVSDYISRQGRVHALLRGPPQRPGPGRARELPAPHLLAGR